MTTTATKMTPIGDCILEVSTWNPQRDGGDDEIYYIDLSSVSQTTKTVEKPTRIIAKNAPSRARQLVRGGDVLVSTVRPNLNGVARVPELLDGSTASTGFCVLRPDPDKLLSEYLLHWVKTPTFILDMTRKATGASYPAVGDRVVCESLIPLPPMAEQRRIAAILDQSEALRTKRREALDKLNALTQSMFLELFGHPHHNRKGFPRHSLASLCERVTVGYVGPMAEEYVASGVPLLRSLNVRRGRIDLADVKFVSEEFHAKLAKSRILPRDVVTVRTGQPGTTAVVPESLPEANCADLIVMTCGDKLNPYYLCEALNVWLGDAESIQGQVGAIQVHFNIGRAKELSIPLPPIDLQQTFESQLSEAEELKLLQRTSLLKLDALFAALQQRAFQGEM